VNFVLAIPPANCEVKFIVLFPIDSAACFTSFNSVDIEILAKSMDKPFSLGRSCRFLFKTLYAT